MSTVEGFEYNIEVYGNSYNLDIQNCPLYRRCPLLRGSYPLSGTVTVLILYLERVQG